MDIDLTRFSIVFGSENVRQFYENELQKVYTRKEIAELMEYETTTTTSTIAVANEPIRTGRFTGFRFRLLCKNSKKSKINPQEVRSKYGPKVFERIFPGKGSVLEEVNEETEKAVWDAIRDGL